MDHQIKWNSSPSRLVTALARPKWKEVRQGLLLAMLGNVLALAAAPAGLSLVLGQGGPLAARLGLPPDEATLLGWVLAVGGAGLGYALVLAGQWRCLLNAPQGFGAKDLLFTCLLCTVVVPACLVGAHFVGGSATYEALGAGPGGLATLDLLGSGPLLQMAGLVLGLGTVLLFSGFARAVSRCINNADSTRSITCYFWFVAFLLGATVGLLAQGKRTTLNGVVPGLALAWYLWLVWHVLLLHGAVRGIGRVLRGERPGGYVPEAVKAPEPGQVVLQAAAYLKRSV